MPVRQLTFPSGECIHVDEARNDRRIDDHQDDAKIKGLIVGARQAAESKTRQVLLHTRWEYTLDAFPAPGCASFVPMGQSLSIPPYALVIPHAPVVAVEKIEYCDMAGQWQTITFPNPDYVVRGTVPTIITPAFGKIWPIPLPQVGSVKVTYTAGYASPITTGGSLASNQLRVTGPVQWAVGDVVQFYNSGGVLPAPLSCDVSYTIASASNGVYTLTDDTGAAVTFTQLGTGRSFIGVVPDGIRAWMLLRVGSMYENREEVAILNRGQIKDLPYIDGLLDPYMAGY